MTLWLILAAAVVLAVVGMSLWLDGEGNPRSDALVAMSGVSLVMVGGATAVVALGAITHPDMVGVPLW